MAIEKQETAWSEAVVMICEKCGRSLPDLTLQESGNASENLKKYLKSTLREMGHGKAVRVINSGCLDVCIKNTVAITYSPVDTSKQAVETFTVHPEEDKAAVLEYVLQKLKK